MAVIADITVGHVRMFFSLFVILTCVAIAILVILILLYNGGCCGTSGSSGEKGDTGDTDATGASGSSSALADEITWNAQTASSYDAFGGKRTVNPFTLFDRTSVMGSTYRTIANDLWFSNVTSGAATVAYDDTPGGYSQVFMTLTSGAGRAIRQSLQYVPYQPAKGRVVYMTGILSDGPVAGVTARMGVFDDDDGEFLELDGTTLYFVERSTTQASSPIRVAQADWDDPMDGTGASGLTLSITVMNVFVLEQAWLGAGPARVGVLVRQTSGTVYTVWMHTFKHTSLTGPYTRSAKLPIRGEIVRTGSGTEEVVMRMLCTSAQSEGGYIPSGIVVPAPETKCGVDDTARAFMMFRLAEDTSPGVPDARILTAPLAYVTMRLRRITVFSRGGANVLVAWTMYHVRNPTAVTAVTGLQSFANVNGSVGAFARLNYAGGEAAGIDISAVSSTELFPVARGLTDARDTTEVSADPADFLTQLPVRATRQSSGADIGKAGTSEGAVRSCASARRRIVWRPRRASAGHMDGRACVGTYISDIIRHFFRPICNLRDTPSHATHEQTKSDPLLLIRGFLEARKALHRHATLLFAHFCARERCEALKKSRSRFTHHLFLAPHALHLVLPFKIHGRERRNVSPRRKSESRKLVALAQQIHPVAFLLHVFSCAHA